MSDENKQNRRLRNIAINLTMMLVSVVITVVLIDVGLYLIFPPTERKLVETTELVEDLGWRYRPNSEQWYARPGEFRAYVTINSQSLRGEEIESNGNAERYTVLGDSFVAAFQVEDEDSFLRLSEADLQEAGESVQFINAGFNGYGTDQQLRWWRAYGQELEPDHLVLVVFVGNDIAENDYELGPLVNPALPTKPYFEMQDGELIDVGYRNEPFELNPAGEEPAGPLNFLRRNSYLFTLVSTLLNQSESNGALRQLVENDEASPIPPHLGIFAANPDPAWERAWSLTETLILTLSDEVGPNTSFSVIIMPHSLQVQENWWERQLEASEVLAAQEWNRMGPNERLGNFLSANEIDHLDLTPHFAVHLANNPEDILYFRRDGHLSQTGHDVTADLLIDFLAR